MTYWFEFISKLSEIDIYIQASPFEGCGISVLEAIKAGKEILISNTGFIAETIRVGNNIKTEVVG